MSRSRSAADPGHQLAVRSAGGFKVLVPYGEFAAQTENLLLRLGGPACEHLDAGRLPKAGCFPNRLARRLGQAPFEPGDVRGYR